jgi:catechol-2,3-dioxygenase
VRLQPIIYTTDPAPVVDWYATVIGIEPSYRSDVWTAFDADGATLGIHRVEALPDRGRVELSLVTAEPLEAVELRLADHGIEPARGIADEAFGRSLLLEDPDGTPVQINEHES